jgi:hypothetical protein
MDYLCGRNVVEKNLSSATYVAPDLLDGIAIAAVDDVSAWSLGAPATITGVPAAGSGAYNICGIFIYAINMIGDYQIKIYDDAVFVASKVFYKKSVTSDDYTELIVTTPIIASGSVITACLAASDNNGCTAKIKVYYRYL